MTRKINKSKNEIAIIAQIAEMTGMSQAPVETNESFADIEAAVSQIEAQESAYEQAETLSEVPAVLEPEAPMLLAAMIESLDDDLVTNMTDRIVAEIDARQSYENVKNPDNANIQRTLKKAREQLATKRTSRVLMAANVDPFFINRELNDGSRYNVYAFAKLTDIVRGVTDGAITNAINIACMRSLFKFSKAGYAFTGEMAKAAASDKIRVDASLRSLLVRHTVSASTAPTQASSTMQALTTLGVVINKGSQKSPLYALTGSALCETLREVCEKIELAA